MPDRLQRIAAQLARQGIGQKSRQSASPILFTGATGTGKTKAAQALANDLGLDLKKVDLSKTIGKYPGETEKNLQHIFDETGSDALLFTEADALFGKRTEVKDAHDRYANVAVEYLLRRVEGHPGLVILATNHKQNIDPAFMRRIRHIVDFPPEGSS